MECYYKSKRSPERGYIKRMHRFWTQQGMFDASEQQLASQANSIERKKRLHKDELKEIRNRVGYRGGERQRCRGYCVIF